jgi:flagellar hook-length control protein FliK
MQTSNALVMTLSTSASGGSGLASAGTAAGTGTSGFGQMLVQLMGSGTASQGSSNALPDLAQLLAGLFSGLSTEETAELMEGTDSAAWSLLVEQLSANPELLEKQLGNEEMQSWLIQAALLLQGMHKFPEGLIPDEVLTGESLSGQGQNATAAINAQQAQVILQGFAKALQEQPDHVFVGQLQEKLAAILSKEPELNTGASKGKAHADSAKEGQEKSNIVWSTASTPLSRLEMLAAKFVPINRTELMGSYQGSTAQESQETGAGATGDQELAPVVSQENQRAPFAKALASAETTTVRSHALAEDISKFMIGKLRIQTGNGLTEARLSLTPEALGQVDVKISMQNGQLVAQFAAHTALGKDAIEAQLSQLRAALQSQGIQVEKMEVTQSPSLQSGMFQDQRGQQQSQQFTRRGEKKEGRDGSEEYAAEASAILNGRRSQEIDGFDVTA